MKPTTLVRCWFAGLISVSVCVAVARAAPPPAVQKAQAAAQKAADALAAAEKALVEKTAAAKTAVSKADAAQKAAKKAAADKRIRSAKAAAEKKIAAAKKAVDAAAAEKTAAEKNLAAKTVVAARTAAVLSAIEKAAVPVKAAAEKASAEKTAAEKTLTDKTATAKTAAQKATVEKDAAKKKAAQEAANTAAAEQAAAAQALASKAAAAKATAATLAAVMAAANRPAAEKAAAEKAAAEKVVAAKTATSRKAAAALAAAEKAGAPALAAAQKVAAAQTTATQAAAAAEAAAAQKAAAERTLAQRLVAANTAADKVVAAELTAKSGPVIAATNALAKARAAIAAAERAVKLPTKITNAQQNAAAAKAAASKADTAKVAAERTAAEKTAAEQSLQGKAAVAQTAAAAKTAADKAAATAAAEQTAAQKKLAATDPKDADAKANAKKTLAEKVKAAKAATENASSAKTASAKAAAEKTTAEKVLAQKAAAAKTAATASTKAKRASAAAKQAAAFWAAQLAAAQKAVAGKQAASKTAIEKAVAALAEARGGLKPLAPDAWDYAKARHLLVRSGFGGTAEEVAKLHAMGLYAAVDYVVDFRQQPASNIAFDGLLPEKPDPLENKFSGQARNVLRQRRQREETAQLQKFREWWLKRMVESPRPLQEKLTLFWHGHFATEYDVVRNSYAFYLQNELFRDHAAGNFGALLYGIVHDAVMIRYLDNNQNYKGHPNENLAREIMELFAMGLDQGYTEEDIKEAARALTGYNFDNATAQFRYNVSQHDAENKTIFGRTGNWSGDDLVRLILQQPATSKFIAGKLFQFFAYRGANPETIDRLASLFKTHQYDLAPTLKNLFLSEEFYSARSMGTQIKSPVQLVVGMLRDFGTQGVDARALDSAIRSMGQELLEPPDVKGWRRGRAWINANRLFIRYNTTANLVRSITRADQKRGIDVVTVLAAQGCENAADVVDCLAKTCLAMPLDQKKRKELIDYVGELPASSEWEKQRNQINGKLLALVVLMVSMPEYQFS